MIVTFTSSETGELLMFAAVARTILQVLGKETSARGTFTRDEMAPAAVALRQAVARAAAAEEGVAEDEEEEEKGANKEPVITLGQRAWPFIDMLERTGRSGPDAHIVWQAAADF
ncbi:MAG: DUF1840 domain-containing protein [Azonexus sp.]|jgi:hypothetical protein|uniref:DUF1840 family protein n=1 Tax=Azonexus sp. TaxID=1872668 RepID=UPI0028304A2C|nr:DUF1840 family protein [Azonexus sp.]MDR0776266.1 DUF1840 domain-containing protein [Azonexus sp.]